MILAVAYGDFDDGIQCFCQTCLMFRAERLYLSVDAVRGYGDCPSCPGFKHGGTYPTERVLSASCLLHDGTGIQSSHLFFLHNQPKAPMEDEGREELFMKHLFTMLLTLVAVTASAQTFEVDGINYNVLSEAEGTVEVTSGDYSGDIVIPASIAYNDREYAVTTVGDHAFHSCSSLTSVSMPSVTAIGDWAFGYCYELASVSMPAVTAIGEYAFIACYALTSVEILLVSTIGNAAFNMCSALTSVSMPEVTTIGYDAFLNCSALISVSMPAVTTIGNGCFFGCSSLTSVSIPASCTSIGSGAFVYCSALEEITVDEDNMYYSSLDGVLYDKNKETILCCPCNKVPIDMPTTVTAIGDYAFCENKSLASASMPSVTTIGYAAFFNCSSLTLIEMPAVTKIGSEAFSFCSALSSVSMPLVETLSNYAFNTCRALTSVYIPASCTSIGLNPFAGCTVLKEIVVEESNPNYSSADGVLYDKDKTTLIGWPTAEDEIDIMPSVTTIGNYAFNYCEALTSVDIPDKVTMIGDGAFHGCSSLSSIYCHWVEPLECDPGFTDDVLENAILFVPRETVDAYRSVKPWSDFANIVEARYSGIADTPAIPASPTHRVRR